MTATAGALAGMLVCAREPHADSRGSFDVLSNLEELAALGVRSDFWQENLIETRRGVLRGLHYQLQQPQGKLVRVIAGSVFDVAVDLRQAAATFGQWVGVELSAQNHKQLWVPPGFAHGFLVLSETAEFVYKTSDYYHPESEVCLSWCDPEVAIEWPIPLGKQALLNAKDAAGLALQRAPTF